MATNLGVQTSTAAYLKQIYNVSMVNSLANPISPLYAKITEKPERVKNTSGKLNIVVPIYSGINNVSADLVRARANKKKSTYREFNLPLADIYAEAEIERKLLLATLGSLGINPKEAKGNMSSFLEQTCTVIDESIRGIVHSVGRGLYRSRSGKIATISAISDTSLPSLTFTLTAKTDMDLFFEGMVIQAAAAETTGGLRATPSRCEIVGINPATGTLTLTALDGSGTTDWAANDSLFVDGCRNAGMLGLDDYCPATAPTTGDSFFGVDRSTSVETLAGVRRDFSGAAGTPIVDRIIRTASYMQKFYADQSHEVAVFVHPSIWSTIQCNANARVVTDNLQNQVLPLGFRAIELNTTRQMRLYADPFCPQTTGWMVDLDCLSIRHLGDMPFGVFQESLIDGHQQSSTADSYTNRVGGYMQLVCNSPTRLARMSFADLGALAF